MKKISFLLILLLSVFAADAQTGYADAGKGSLIKKNNAPLCVMKKAKSAPSRVALAEGERLMGYYTGEETGSVGSSFGITDRESVGKYYQAGCDLSEDITERFVGGQITRVRFAAWDAFGPSEVYVYKVTGTKAPVLVTSEELSLTAVGWNEAALSNPVVIESGVRYLLAYKFMQRFNKYPMALDTEVNPAGGKPGGLLIYGDLGYGEVWNNLGTDYGNHLIQAVVKGGDFADYDITIDGLATYGAFCRKGGRSDFQFSIKNSGNKLPESYSLKVMLDGADIDADMKLPEMLGGFFQTVEGSFTLPENVASGVRRLSVRVDKINGVTPVEGTDDDELAVDFNAYDKSYSHTKQLVEHYTSQYCTNCPGGYDMLNALSDKRDDIAWVSVHGDMSATQTDEYTLPESYYIRRFSTTGYPTAAFNRMFITGTSLAMAINAPQSQLDGFVSTVSEIMDLLNNAYYPAFATVGIATDYDKASGKLKIKVTGEKSAEDYSLFVGDDAVLTVYLTEDGLVSPQLDGSNTLIKDYPHDNVLRSIVSKPLGDVISWNGDTYENNYEVSLKDGWNADNMNVVAFISRPIGYDENYGKYTTSISDAWVINTNKAKAGDTVSGMSGIFAGDGEAHEVARYTVDGRRVDGPVKGLNIVKMSDGRTVKVIVK